MPIAGPLTADVTDSTSATLTDTGLAFPVASGRTYHFEAFIPYTTAATTTGIGVAVDVPASPTFFTARADTPNATGATVGTDSVEADATVTDAEQMTFTGLPSTSGALLYVQGVIRPSVAGEVKVQFNTEVDTSLVTVKKGSYIRYRDCG